MNNNASLHLKIRILHRYLGFFLAGIMMVYSLSGVILIFRNTDFLKQENTVIKQIDTEVASDQLGTALGIRNLKVTSEDEATLFFENGSYDKSSGQATYTVKELPLVIDKMTHLHKAKSGEPLYFLNIFFGCALLFFVLSSFWMFLPNTTVFKKGMIYAGAGAILTLILLFLK